MSRKKKRSAKDATHSASSLESASPAKEANRAEAICLSETVDAQSADVTEAPSLYVESDMSAFQPEETVGIPPPPSELEAVVQSGSALSETMLRIVKGLMDSSYEQQERNLGSLKKLLECRTPQDFAELQRNLLRNNIESFLAYGRRMLHPTEC